MQKNRDIVQSAFDMYLSENEDFSHFAVARFFGEAEPYYIAANPRVLQLFQVSIESLPKYTRGQLFALSPAVAPVGFTISECEAAMRQKKEACTQNTILADDRGYSCLVEVSSSPVFSASEIIGSINTIRKKNQNTENSFIGEDEILNHINQIKALKRIVEINEIVNSGEAADTVYSSLMEKVRDVMIAEAASLMLYDESDNSLEFTVAVGLAGETLQGKQRISIEKGFAGWVARNRVPLVINDPYSDERFDRSFDEKSGFRTKSLVCAPLIWRGEILGVIQAINPIGRRRFTEFDIELFSVFAGLASLAVAQTMTQAAIKESKDNSIKLFFRLLSDREKEYLLHYSGGFSRREIAKVMDVFPETCDAYLRRILSKIESITSDTDRFLEDVTASLKMDKRSRER